MQKKEKKEKAEKQESERLIDKIKEAREKSKPRGFVQTWDLLINLKGIDLKKPENRLNLEFFLPEGRGKDVKIAVVSDSPLGEGSKADLLIKKDDINSLAANKKKMKKIANEYDWFLAEVSLMPLVGKFFGGYLGPRGKMAKPIPPKMNLEPFIEKAKNSVRISLKETPVIQIPVGSESMPDESIAKNLESIYNFVKEKLPKGKNNIRSVYIKLTMGRPVKLGI